MITLITRHGVTLKEDARNSWFEMVDSALDHIFLSKAAGIMSDLFTEEEANEYIIEKSNHYIEEYAKLDNDEAHELMLKKMLASQARDLLEELEEMEAER